MTTSTHKPILPRRRPLWIVVLAGMLVFGFYQERAKVQLNHVRRKTGRGGNVR